MAQIKSIFFNQKGGNRKELNPNFQSSIELDEWEIKIQDLINMKTLTEDSARART